MNPEMESSREAALADMQFQLVRPHLGELPAPLRGLGVMLR